MIYTTVTVHYCPHLCYHNNNDEDNSPSVKIITSNPRNVKLPMIFKTKYLKMMLS